jgi:PAS domain S-box-containing protein
LQEGEFETVLAAAGEALTNDNVVPMGKTPRAQALLRERERRFHALLEALPTAVYTTDAAGRLTYYNTAAAMLWGHRPTLGVSQWCGAWKLYWPDGTPLAHADCPMAVSVRERRALRDMEAIAERPDGTRVPFLAAPTPLFDAAGKLVGAVNMLIDITERKRAEDQQALLVRELHHRVKNTLATVQAIMSTTARSAKTIEEFRDTLIGRIGSLAKTHLLLSDEGGVIDFGGILYKELNVFDSGSDGRVVLSGPPVELPSQLAITLGMAIHELTINAVRFGALSVPEGRVDVSWTVTIAAAGRRLDFEWTESSGPRVTKPKSKGFGGRLLDIVLPGQIQAKSTVDYRREGVHITCSVPLPAEAAA